MFKYSFITAVAVLGVQAAPQAPLTLSAENIDHLTVSRLE